MPENIKALCDWAGVVYCYRFLSFVVGYWLEGVKGVLRYFAFSSPYSEFSTFRSILYHMSS